MAVMAAMMLLGLLVLFLGVKSLLVVLPAAVLVWYSAEPRFPGTRN